MSVPRRKGRDAALPPPERSLRVVRALVGGGALTGLLLCPQLWLSARTFPTAPVFEALPDIGRPLDGLLYALLLLAAAASALVPARHALRAVGTLLVLAVTLALFDQSRIQPWLYLDLALLLAAAVGETRADSRAGAERGLLTCLLLAACTYAWSGIHKTNAGFTTRAFPWLLEAHFSKELSAQLAPLGWLLGPAEAAMGIGLLFVRTRRPAALAIVAMHCAILLAVGPLGHGWNAVVWPWNVVMSVLVLLLARRTPGASARAVLSLRGQVLRPALLLLFGVLPALALVGRWDNYLSSALYAGNETQGAADLPPRLVALLPADVRALATPLTTGGQGIGLTDWAERELGVPVYPERRVLLQVHQRLCARARAGERVDLLLLERPARWTGVRPAPVRLPCSAPGNPDD